MELWDRLTATARPLADIGGIEPARYLLRSPLQHNGHTPLEEGDVLLDDGSTRLRLDDAVAEFAVCGEGGPEGEELAIALDAVTAVAARADLSRLRLPSPLLPPELSRELEQSNLELVLRDVLEAGHLEAIAARPRQTMRYDAELMPVARARRLDNGFQRHLAAHSECWAQQTISGIVPKRVLARVSEDEANIYENRVYCRLLDHLARYIKSRLRRLARIGNTYREALHFEGSEATDFRLRERVCATWGEAFAELEGDLELMLLRNEEQIQRLRRWLRRIKGLQRGSLYAAVPRSAQVGLNIGATNLLLHDPHYRQVRRLWMAWLRATASDRERSPQVLERRRTQQRCYEDYVGVVLLRTLQALNWEVSAHEGGWLATHPSIRWLGALQVTCTGHAWQLELGGAVLELVPAAVALDTAMAARWRTRRAGEHHTVIPCVPWASVDNGAEENPGTLLGDDAPALILTPLDLYSEERLAALLSGWSWRLSLQGYGQTYPALPQAVVDAWPVEDRGANGSLSLRRPPAADERSTLTEALAAHVRREDLRALIAARLGQLAHMEHCPSCGARARFFNATGSGFYCECACGYRWKLKDGVFTGDRSTPELPKPTFRSSGREWVCVDAG